MKRRAAVIGGGAAGMMAACAAALSGHEVYLFEHNEKLGKKIYITGRGRCNLTNSCDSMEVLRNVPRNHAFLYSAVCSFDPYAVMDFFSSCGLKMKTERGNRVFPVSDHASDVTRALESEMERLGVRVALGHDVKHILTNENAGGRSVSGIAYKRAGRKEEVSFDCDAVIIATGGLSYSSTGCDGSGYRMCEELGHSTVPMRPAVTGMITRGQYPAKMQGLSLKNIRLTFYSGSKKLYSETGEMLFTHKGISGPLVLSASSLIPDEYFEKGKEISFSIDLKPALDPGKLDARISRDFSENINRRFKNSLSGLLPSAIIPAVISLSGIDPEKEVNSVTREERKRLAGILKAFPGRVCALAGFDEAVTTRGGINVKEVNPSTMESRLVSGLYICGEMLDYDALTGGFNLQAAWSTGHLAGSSL